MDEAEARARLDVPHETLQRLEAFVVLLAEENARQNLVSRASLEAVWSRHILDSAQLLAFDPGGAWLDLGSGAGFPGLIVAALREGPTTLVEARKLRVDFLRRAAQLLGIEARVEILCSKVEAVAERKFDAISARAFAPLDRLFGLGSRFSGERTTWLLPKGRNAQRELEAAQSSWQGDFRLEPSLTDPDSWIVIAERVRRKGKGKKAR